MMVLPVREMVLYKHGVGFFVRQGDVASEEITLDFRQDEINDVLKSLTVFDMSGGQVLGIHYQTPMDLAARLANTSIRLSDRASLSDLLRDLRGRQVELAFEIVPGSLETGIGRVIGLEMVPAGPTPPGTRAPDAEPGADRVSLLDEQGTVRVFPFDQLRGMRILDAQAEHDLRYFLDTRRGDENRRSVSVRLSPGEHQLVVYYVAPSPTWRVSYRLVAESEENAETGRALLQGWGLFDNRLEEDLVDVRVTLVAGQPISFIYDLYASRIPQRPTIADQSRVAPGPVEIAAELSDGPDFLADAGPEARARDVSSRMLAKAAPRASIMAGVGAAASAAPSLTRETVAQSTRPAAETKDAGEFFQYEVRASVTVKRGESALVPIIGADISYQRELLYNAAKLPRHPVATLRFVNTSGLTLERGPVTVVENGDYKGEAVIAFTKDGSPVYIPYAVELGVRIAERPETYTETTSLSIQGGYFVFQEYHASAVTYIIENTTARDLTITIEAPIHTGLELFETPLPDVETLFERRWRVACLAGAKTEFVRKERRLAQRKEEVRDLDYQKLAQYMRKRWLDEDTYKQLGAMLDNLAQMQKAAEQQIRLTRERDTIYVQQEQLRANLGALQPAGPEAALRARVLTQLETSQNRLEAIEQEYAALEQQMKTATAEVSRIIAALG